jgi:pyruvate/2-oxoacid:ferredoxin oxidoreductase beta subunit
VVDGQQRNNHWCPACGARFILNLKGQAFTGAANGIAPATVECVTVGADGFTNIVRKTHGAVTVLGRLFEQWIAGTDVIIGCC